jgi:hypothetical protein
VGAKQLWVLDRGQETIAELPINPGSEVILESKGADWKLVIHSGEGRAELRYRGNFGEHLARVAESTIRSRLHRELPIVQ